MNDDCDVVRLYLSGLSSYQIARMDGFKSSSSIKRILERNGIKRRSISETLIGQRRALKHFCEEGFFDNISTQKQAYLLGLLVADGNILVSRSQGYRVSFTSVDMELVVLVKKLLKATHPIRSRKDGGFEIVLSSKRLIDGLKKYGCGERKSLTANWPNLINTEMYRHFIRGLFDGDGGVWVNNQGSTRASIVGSLEMMSALSNMIAKEVGFKMNVKPHGSIWRVAFCGNHRAKRFSKFIYQGAEYFLKRKKKVFDETVTRYRVGHA